MSKFKVGDIVKIEDEDNLYTIKQRIEDVVNDRILYLLWVPREGYNYELYTDDELTLITTSGVPVSELKSLFLSIQSYRPVHGDPPPYVTDRLREFVEHRLKVLISKYGDES